MLAVESSRRLVPWQSRIEPPFMSYVCACLCSHVIGLMFFHPFGTWYFDDEEFTTSIVLLAPS
jgi:hypothetical protein